MKLDQRKIARFRAHYDPMIGPKPKLAFDIKEMKAEAEMTPAGVWIKIWVKGPNNSDITQEHVVPYSNVQSIMLAQDDAPKAKMVS